MGRLYYSAPDSASDSTTNGTSITPPEKLQCVYIVASHPFPEVDKFVETSSAEYGLEVARYVLPMKKGLEIYLEERPSIKAVFVGTRRTDPHGENLTFFDPTDAGWPSFMRIHPVIDWHYGTFSILVSSNGTITNGTRIVQIWAVSSPRSNALRKLTQPVYPTLGYRVLSIVRPRLHESGREKGHTSEPPPKEAR